MADLPEPFSPAGIQIALGILGKMGVGVLLGGVIGWERETHGRPAGVRTHMLVVLGVVLLSEVSRQFGGGDPGRIAAQIVTGIGFLGAGTILRMGPEIRGLTSAASIWASAGIGMAISVGGPFLVVAVISTLLVLLTLSYVDHLERRLHAKAHPKELFVVLDGRDRLPALIECFTHQGLAVQAARFVASVEEAEVGLVVQGNQDKALAAATAMPGVRSTRWSD